MPTINPRNLRQLRQRKRWSLDELARRSKVDRGTISRIECGKQASNRLHTVQSLASALGADVETLVGSDLDDRVSGWDSTEKSQMNIRMSHDARNALTLVAERYGVKEAHILHLAPFLFLAAAEESLRHRQRKADALQDQWDAIKEGPSHLTGLTVSNWQAEEALEDERRSIRRRDIFGTALGDDSLRSDYEESEHNPMAVHLAELAGSLSGLVKFEHWSPYWDRPGYTVSTDLARHRVGDDTEAAEHIVCGNAPLHELPKELRNGDPSSVASWAKTRGEEVQAELERLLDDLKFEI